MNIFAAVSFVFCLRRVAFGRDEIVAASAEGPRELLSWTPAECVFLTVS